MKKIWFLLILLLAGAEAMAQTAALNIQGVLRDIDGMSVPDGQYTLGFVVYDAATGGNVEWDAGTRDLDLENGVYNVVLTGFESSLSFNENYYVAITRDGTEFDERIQLTTAPYALSLVGSGNKFPASGTVGFGTINPVSDDDVKLEVRGNMAVWNPGQSTALIISPSDNGYGDDPELYIQSADIASGGGESDFHISRNARFSGGDYYRINTEQEASGIFFYNGGRLAFNHTPAGGNQISWTENMDFTQEGDLGLDNGLVYYDDDLPDWRLLSIEDFESGDNGWNAYAARNSSSTRSDGRTNLGGRYGMSWIFRSTNSNNDILKENYNNIPAAATSIKINLTYYFIDSWDSSD
ncbi:MAG: hypothetical protein GY869_23455, partial [Planctomycetes bacterium]|nr:hypothetical protein [Planctomycetota bacterium]